ncbi:MAG TPA: glycerate kinase [Candidatus Obscuribacterales bacterium]
MGKKILIAPTAFKGTLSPQMVARAIEDGVVQAGGRPPVQIGIEIESIILPLADGGDGTLETVYQSSQGRLHDEQVLGATGKPVHARWLQLDRQALVELASCCGIGLLSVDQLNPLQASTYGLGQMICRCREFGMETINVALGGSASTDGGMGALRAIGVCFFDRDGKEIDESGGAALSTVRDVDVTGARWLTRESKLRVLTDVHNPLLGAQGAAHVFAPQKGASSSQVDILESAMQQYADVLEQSTGKRLRDVPGAGAAGGTAFGLACCLDAEIASGFQWLAGIAGLEDKLRQCDLVITGEGRFDSQSLSGKVTGELLKLCRQYNKPLWVVAGAAAGHEAITGLEKIIVPQAKAGSLCNADDITASVSEALQLFPLVEE